MTDKEVLQAELDNNAIFQANFNWEYDGFMPDGFEKWFVENGEHLNGSLKEIPAKFKPKQTTGSQCFHNSRLLSQNHLDVKYYEGIMFGPVFKTCFHNGFNVVEDNTVDLTYIYNKENFHNEEMRDDRYIYFGVHIPKEFIEKYKDKINAPNIHNPMLLDYFNSLQS